MNHLVVDILHFLDEIGIQWKREIIQEPSFLPGLRLKKGTLIIDEEKLGYPGDILHEAGHLATMPPAIRAHMDGNLESNDLHQGGEMMAIAWSYAACIYLKIDPHIVFHENGYKGAGASIVKNFQSGHYFGVPLLQWCGMTYEPKQAKEQDKIPFPYMYKWLCEERPL